jgi:hypothetical protein
VGCREEVPVWHEKMARYVKEGKLVLLGVTQEQHADRCRLFAQRHRFHWPILYDPINLLELSGVPLLVAVDEHGIVRSTKPALGTFWADFVDKTFADEATTSRGRRIGPPLRKVANIPDWQEIRARARQADSVTSWRELGDALALWGSDKAMEEALTAYSRAVQRDPKDGPAWFRLGVCFRSRYDSPKRQPHDFQAAIDTWGNALGIDPNQYIWRRRIQQYGPRLDKPYSFFDWVTEAEKAVRARGEEPVRLGVRPTGPEIAYPIKVLPDTDKNVVNPDPTGKVHRDQNGLIEADTTVIPSQVRPGRSFRVYIVLTPSSKKSIQWNNEGEPLRLWVEPPQDWHVSERLLEARVPAQAHTSEPRILTFEFKVPATATGKIHLPVYALYNVCDVAGGQCRFLRLDIPVTVSIAH